MDDADVLDTDVVGSQDRSNGGDSACFINQITEQLVNRADRTTMRDVERITVFLGRTEKFFDLFRVTFCYGVSGFLQCIDIVPESDCGLPDRCFPTW